MDENLKLNNHVKNVERKICNATGMLWKLKYLLPTDIKKKIYCTLLQTHLSYMISIWGAANESIIKPLQIIQNRALRNVFGVGRLTNRIEMYMNDVEDCLPIRALHFVQSANYVYCIVNQAIHTNLQINTSNSTGRHAHELRTTTSKTNYGRRMITSLGVHIFNRVPREIQVISSAASFRWNLKRYVMNEEFISTCFSSQYVQKYSKSIG
jgi:hypothetical protein